MTKTEAAINKVVTVQTNPGHDTEHSIDRYPFMVFVRDTFNPLCSAWTFCESKIEADRVRCALRIALGMPGDDDMGFRSVREAEDFLRNRNA